MNDLMKLYIKALNEEEQKKYNVEKDYWRLGYHLMPPVGWLNDPNGLCEFNGEYHVFYQYSPTDVNGGLKFWGHYTSKDFINWTKHDVAIYPDQVFDLHGVFSGTSFIEEGKMNCYYTGTVKRQGYNDNYEIEGMEQNTILVTSEDGFTFSDKKLLLTNEDYPNMSWHVRDPKVWREEDIYYMVLGARSKSNEGCILLYYSEDKINWKYINTLKTKERFGYMWECPDLFEIDNKKLLITCPQGVELDGIDLVNIHQCGYFIIEGDIKSDNYEFSKFITLDRGFDFYAPQTFLDSKGRRILIGWLSISDTPFAYPTVDNGWNHCLSIPRELNFKNNKLIQCPIEELKSLRKETVDFEIVNGEMNKVIYGDKYELEINFENGVKILDITLRKDIKITYVNSEFKLTFGASGYGRDERKVIIEKLENIRVFMDTSSIEIFLNNGEEVFTSRVFPEKDDLIISIFADGLNVYGKVYLLDEFNYK